MITQEQIDQLAKDLAAKDESLFHMIARLHLRIDVMVKRKSEQKEEKSFEEWWLSYRIPVDYDINEVARAAWQAALKQK